MKNDVKGFLIMESAVVTSKPNIISDTTGVTVIEAILQEANLPNRNKRVYSKQVLQSALNSDYVKERLRTKSFYGESGHPLKPDIKRQMYIDQTRISHIVTDVYWEGNLLKAKVESANTQAGKDFQGLIRQGSQVAFSMRGVGGVQERRGDIIEVKAPLNILSYDWVIHPSHAVAYQEKIIQESADFYNVSTREMAHAYNEGCVLDLNTTLSEAIDLVANSSRNYRAIVDQLEIDTDNSSFNLNEGSLDITSPNKSVRILLEDYVNTELNSYLRNKF